MDFSLSKRNMKEIRVMNTGSSNNIGTLEIKSNSQKIGLPIAVTFPRKFVHAYIGNRIKIKN